MFAEVLFLLGIVNIGLAVFNLLPIPPLDGSVLLERLLPRAWWPTYLRFRSYTFFLMLGLVIIFFGGRAGSARHTREPRVQLVGRRAGLTDPLRLIRGSIRTGLSALPN